jgi:monofunctional biosynthetic peptidoglycan transglycosylase
VSGALRRWAGGFGRALALLAVAALALQLALLLRVAAAVAIDPRSTTMQRSEAWRLVRAGDTGRWRQRWVDDAQISPHLKRAVIAAEDARFADHTGVEWDAIEKAWEKNQRAAAVAERANARAEQQAAARAARGLPLRDAPASRPARVVGASTITQQLAKNLLLGGERTLLRKGEELLLTFALEALLDKRRILEIYLNSVEWGDGVFGAEAAAQHYFRVDAGRLTPRQAAQLAVMLPAPKRFEQRPGSAYVQERTATIAARMGDVVLP